jgi:hypothetical protein
VKPAGTSLVGSIGRSASSGSSGLVEHRLAAGVQAVPERERHAEEALPADQPVAVQPADPVLVPALHEARVPVELLAAGEQLVAQVGVPAAVAQVPLPARDDLERPVAALVELHRVGDRLRLAEQVAGLGQQLHDPLLRLLDALAGQLGVRLHGHALGRRRHEAAVPADHAADRQVELAPPRDVGGVAEGADHRDAGALGGIGQLVRVHRHLDAEQRRRDGRAEQRRVALVVGVGDQGHAGRQQLRPGRLDQHRVGPGAGEGDPVVGARHLPVGQLGLRDGGLVVDVPQRGRLGGVRLAAGQVAQERALGGPAGPVADGLVGVRPVHDRPSRLNSASKTFSSSADSRWHSSTKFCRLMLTCGLPFFRLPLSAGGSYDASYCWLGSQRTP